MQRTKMLIVDDEQDMTQLLKMEFEDAGFQVCIISSVPEALEYLKTNSIDILLTDLNIGGHSGLDIINSLPEGHNVMTLISSGLALGHLKELANVHGCFAKPFEIEDVIQFIKGFDH